MTRFSKILTFIVVCALCAVGVFATATVTPATGGSAIDNSTAGGAFTNLTGPVISEGVSIDIGNGTIVLNAPSGFEFDTSASVTVLVTRTAGGGPPSRNINDVVSGTSLAVTSITSSTITFTVTDTTNATFPPGPAGVTNSLTWQGVRIRPTAVLPLASGDITKSGASSIVGVPDGTSLGTLTETAVDSTPPVVTVPADMTEEATSASGAVVAFSSSALDDVDGAITPSCIPVSGSTFALGATSVNCSATDSAGNTGAALFTVTVVDTTDPVLTLPADITTEATSPAGAIVDYFPLVSATDLVDASPSISCLPPGGPFPIGTTTVTCDATDASGNIASDSFDVIVEDTTPPVLSGMPSDDTVEATSSAGAVYAYSNPTASDIADPSPVVSCVPPSGSTFPLGTTTATCTATDAAGNDASAGFDVTVVDTTAPTITAPSDISTEATGPTTVVPLGSPVVSDAVDPAPSVSNDAPAGFPVGTTIVIWTATDSSGNSAADTQDVTVTDTTAPVFSGVPSDITDEATSSSGATVAYTDPTASDLVDGSVAVGCVPASGSTFPLGTTPVTCTASDTAGNIAADGFNVTVVDTTPPSITGTPSDMTVEATDASGAAVPYIDPTASDLVDGPVAVSCLPASGSTFPIGTTGVICTATDSATNSDSTSFNITVSDTTAPLITAPSDVTTEATGPTTPVALGSPTVLDAVDPSPIVTNDAPASFPVGTTIVNWTATDASSNGASAAQSVTVTDTTAPVITLLGSNPVSITVGTAYSDAGATALDLVDGNLTGAIITVSTVNASTVGTYTVTYNVNDTAGNPAAAVARNVSVTAAPAPPAPSGGGGGGSGGGGGGGSSGYTPYNYTSTTQGTVPLLSVLPDTSSAPQSAPPESETAPETLPPEVTVPETPSPEAPVPQTTGIFGLPGNAFLWAGIIGALILLVALGIWAFRKKK